MSPPYRSANMSGDPAERQALMHLWASLGGRAAFLPSTRWGSIDLSFHICSWMFVECNAMVRGCMTMLHTAYSLFWRNTGWSHDKVTPDVATK